MFKTVHTGTIMKSLIPLLFCITFLQINSFAQENEEYPKTDTIRFYQKIQKAAYKRKFTKLLYQAIFVDHGPLKYEIQSFSDEQKIVDPRAKYVGKYIHNINVLVYDPFGYSANDTTSKITNSFQKLGNKYHITTRHRIILNLLLFKPDDTVDMIRVTESERILREMRYITDARIYIAKAGDSTDRVDVKVVIHDRWSLDIPVSGGTTGGHATIRDRNLFGTGQVFEQYVGYSIPDNYYDFRGLYSITNIKRSFIGSDFFYTTTRDETQTGFSFNRPFYSPLAKWAGGISGVKSWGNYTVSDSVDGEPLFERKIPLSYISYDTWVATSYKPKTQKKLNRKITNIIFALRYAGMHYQSRPSFAIDTNKFNHHYSLYLGSVGFSLNKFYKDRYIFRFGANEDVPEGITLQFLYGLINREDIGMRYYTGCVMARGKHYENIGYILTRAEYGTFYNKNVSNDATMNLGLIYFTDLIKTNYKWHFRQFVYCRYLMGINKQPYDKITLLPEELYGFNNGSLLGSSKILLNLEGVAYAPYNFIGFKFAPVAFFGFGMIKTDDYKLLAGQVYQAYSVGLLIRNENLLTSSFEITYGFYPNQPDDNKQIGKFNPSISFRLKVNPFDISKPATVVYR